MKVTSVQGQWPRAVSFAQYTVLRIRVFGAGNIRISHWKSDLADISGGVNGGIPIAQADCVQAGGSIEFEWRGDLWHTCDGVATTTWILEFDNNATLQT